MKGSSATTLRSIQDAKDQLTRFLKTLDTVPVKILEEEAAKIQKEAKEQTPYKTGKLEKSVRVKVSKNSRKPGLLAQASAKSPRGYNYAGIQHENTRFKHPVKGKAHYLRDPFEEGIKRIEKRLEKEVKL